MRCLKILAVVLLSVGLSGVAMAAMPAAGVTAPSFRLQDQNGHWRSPANYHGHWLVMYFYPKDFTGGCTAEVCSFRDDITKLRQAGAEVIGVSLDNPASHAAFAAKYHVPFPLLADSKGTVATTYGVIAEDGGEHYAKRTTFLIDPQGKIAKVYVDVDPEKNSAQVLHDLASLKASS